MKILWHCKCGYKSWEDDFNKDKHMKTTKVTCSYCGKKMYKNLKDMDISTKTTKKCSGGALK